MLLKIRSVPPEGIDVFLYGYTLSLGPHSFFVTEFQGVVVPSCALRNCVDVLFELVSVLARTFDILPQFRFYELSFFLYRSKLAIKILECFRHNK